MIYLALAVAVCVAVWEAIQLVKTRRELRATKDELARLHLLQRLYTEDCRVIAEALRRGAETRPLDADQIGGTD